MLEWVGGKFDPEYFDERAMEAAAAAESM